MKVEMMPHKGVMIKDTLIELGADIRMVNINYDIENYDNIYYLFDGNLQIETIKNKICLITCCMDYSSTIVPTINGKILTQLKSDTVIDILNNILKEKGISIEESHSYIWPGLDVCCWREITPDEIEEMVIETREEGVYEEMKKDIERDILQSQYFNTISIGKRGYYDDYL